jgi:hypothetical protein
MQEDSDLLKNMSKLKLPELKEKLFDKYEKSKVHKNVEHQIETVIGKREYKDPVKDRKLFIEYAERFLSYKPYMIENRSQLESELRHTNLRNEIRRKEKQKLEQCEKKFDKIIRALSDGAIKSERDEYEDFY